MSESSESDSRSRELLCLLLDREFPPPFDFDWLPFDFDWPVPSSCAWRFFKPLRNCGGVLGFASAFSVPRFCSSLVRRCLAIQISIPFVLKYEFRTCKSTASRSIPSLKYRAIPRMLYLAIEFCLSQLRTSSVHRLTGINRLGVSALGMCSSISAAL